ncbi:MAG TPA: hypothetical protein VGC06_10375 [Actinomycetes bacterium]
MSRRSTWLAWLLLAIYIASVIAAVVLEVANGSQDTQPVTDTAALLLAFTAFMVMGALIVAHRPGNAIGWIFSAIALLAITGALAEEYGRYAYLTRPGALPGAILASWFSSWAWFPTIALALVFTVLLFPTGRLLSPRWRPVAGLAVVDTAAITVLAALQPSLTMTGDRQVPNPIGVAAVGNPEQTTIGSALLSLLVLLAVVASVSLIIRFLRSRGDQRQQVKWFAFACVLLPLVTLGDVLPTTVGNVFFALLVSFLPVAAGIAILRYRLYDIDRLINRTLVYGLLTALLAGVYAGLVLGLGQAFGGLGAEPPSWAVGAATLAVAALFQPARRRIQGMVDRRFNRRRYDAVKTIEGFRVRLREQLDLDALSAELLGVVDQTMEPTTVSLWLQPHARVFRDHGDAVPHHPAARSAGASRSRLSGL